MKRNYAKLGIMGNDKYTKLYDLRLTSRTISEQKVSEKVTEMIDSGDRYASICVSAAHVEYTGVTLGDSEMAITAIVNSDTYCEVLMLECAMAMENGADEIEMALNVAELIERNDEKVKSELKLIKEEIEDNAILKVDLLADKLNEEQLQRATTVAIAAGADFVITTRDKIDSVALLLKKSTKRVGIKIKGTSNERETEAALQTITSILGDKYDTSELVRFDRSISETDL